MFIHAEHGPDNFLFGNKRAENRFICEERIMEELDKKQYIRVRGANEHNLKNINVDIPRNQFVVLTGLSLSLIHILQEYPQRF